LEKGKMLDMARFTSTAPSNVTDPEIIWSSSDNAIAVVTGSGLVRAMSSGTATIIATATDGGGAAAI